MVTGFTRTVHEVAAIGSFDLGVCSHGGLEKSKKQCHCYGRFQSDESSSPHA